MNSSQPRWGIQRCLTLDLALTLNPPGGSKSKSKIKSKSKKACQGTRSTPWERGFTLIELVISTALMAMILGGAYVCLRAGLDTQELVEAREDVFQNARVALALLSADLRCACPLSKDVEFVGMQRKVGEVRADNLDFGTHNYTPRRPREFDWCEVSYFLDKDPSGSGFSLWRRRDPTPDDDPFSGGSREEIARGVHGLRFEYYDGIDWYDEWGDPQGHGKASTSLKDKPNLTGMPEAVRVTLWFDSKRRTAQDSSSNSTSTEPPVVFQTVARLNLAAASLNSSASGSSTNAAGASPDQAPPAPPTGGPP
jgi:type II secretion system protein J